jgi:prepilin-type N-terminal cleavage/methylation domain-containing protein
MRLGCINRKKEIGFSLIEVLVGLTILAVGLLAVGSLLVTSIRGNSFSNNLMQATYVAQDGLEFLKNLPPESPALQPGNYDLLPTTLLGVIFNHSYTVVIKDDLKTINYTVTWNDGRNHHITFSTIRLQ